MKSQYAKCHETVVWVNEMLRKIIIPVGVACLTVVLLILGSNTPVLRQLNQQQALLDHAALNDDDLRPPLPLPVADKENGLLLMQKALGEWKYLDDEDKDHRKLVNMSYGREPVDRDFIVRLAADNQSAMQLFQQALEKPYLRRPRPWKDEFFPYSRLLALVHLDLLEGQHLFQSGRKREGLEKARQMLALGSRTEEAREDALSFAVSIAVRQTAVDVYSGMLAEVDSDTDVPDLVRDLSRYRPKLAYWQYFLKQEYVQTIEVIDDYEQKHGGRFFLGGGSFFYHPNRTRALLAERTRQNLRYLESPHGAARPEPCPDESAIPRLMPNPVGQMLFFFMCADSSNLSLAYHRLNTLFSLHSLWHALHAYKRKNGALPKTLAELSPRYLEAVPPDSFDGQAIRYRPGSGIIYSIGTLGTEIPLEQTVADLSGTPGLPMVNYCTEAGCSTDIPSNLNVPYRLLMRI